MELGLSGKKVVVTGSSKGIGFSCAEAFAAEGCDVVITSRSADALAKAADDLRSRHQVNVTPMALDLSKRSERDQLAQAHGDADILVNNAGAIPGGTILSLSMDTWEEAWSLKVMGYIHLTQHFLKRMAERRQGTIINIVGMAGRQPRWDYICGAAGNASLIAFTNGVGGGASDLGVRVLGISPGATRTDRIITLSKSRAKTAFDDESRWEEMLKGGPFDRIAEPEEVASLAVMLASDKVAYVSGTVIDLDGGAQFRG